MATVDEEVRTQQVLTRVRLDYRTRLDDNEAGDAVHAGNCASSHVICSRPGNDGTVEIEYLRPYVLPDRAEAEVGKALGQVMSILGRPLGIERLYLPQSLEAALAIPDSPETVPPPSRQPGRPVHLITIGGQIRKWNGS